MRARSTYRRIATYINNKLGEFQGMEELRHLSGDMKATYVAVKYRG